MKYLSDLKDAIKGFVFNNSNVTDLFQGGTDSSSLETKLDNAILIAVNNARKWAERKHDFEFTYVNLTVDFPIEGLDLNAQGLRTLKSIWFDGTPISIITKRDLELRLQNKKQRLGSVEPLSVGNWPLVVVQGHKALWYPELTEVNEVEVCGYQWIDDYEWPSCGDVGEEDEGYVADTTDWLIQHGFDFLMWQSIIELNFIVQIFVTRQEGVIAPPDRLRDAAWESLIICDSHGMAGGIWHG